MAGRRRTQASRAETAGPAVPWLDPVEQTAWRSFIAGSRRLLERLDQDLKAQGVTHDDYGVLVALSESNDDRLRMSELAATSVESRSRLSHHVGRLEARGLVHRESCPGDRRGLFAVLTPDGRRLIEAIAPYHVAGVRAWFLDHVTPDELAMIATAFARIDAALVDDVPCPTTAPEAACD